MAVFQVLEPVGHRTAAMAGTEKYARGDFMKEVSVHTVAVLWFVTGYIIADSSSHAHCSQLTDGVA